MMKRVWLFTVVAICTPGYAQATSRQFDLQCVGESNFGEMKEFLTGTNKSPFSMTIRVDLDEQRWCSNSCTETKPLFAVVPIEIWFESKKDGDFDNVFYVNRENGKMLQRLRLAGFISMDTAICTSTPFSGFPTRKF